MSENARYNCYINAGSLFFFGEDLATSFKEDVLNCTLYCQLAASKKYNKFSDMAHWCSRYFDALPNFAGPIVYRDVQSLPVVNEVSIWDCARDSLAKRVSPAMLERAEKTLKHLASSVVEASVSSLLRAQTLEFQSVVPNAGPQDEECTPLSRVNLQLGFVETKPVINLLVLSFSSTLPINKLPAEQLFMTAGISGNLDIAIASVELDEYSYDRVRDKIVTLLSERREQLIIGLEEGTL